MKRHITISLIAVMLFFGLMTVKGGGYAPGSNYTEPGGVRTVIQGSLDVVSGGDLDIESGATFKVAGNTVVLPGSASAIIYSTLTTNAVDAANSLWGVSNGITFEGSTANAFQSLLTVADPTTPNKTWTLPDATGTVMLSTLATNGPEVANSVTGGTNQLIFEGTVDDFETIYSATDATVDRTILAPDAGGTIMLSSLATNGADAANAVTGASNSILWEGTADAFETSLEAIDPTYDNVITLPDAGGSVSLSSYLANADVDDSTSSTKWATSDQVNWTITEGTGNSRDGGNFLILKTDATVDDELEMDYGAVLDISAYNYIGFWMYNTGGEVVTDELDVELRSPANSVITNCGDLDIPSFDQDDWTWIEFDISACNSTVPLSRFQKFVIEADTNITALTAVDIGAIIVYKLSNGHGPPRGRLETFLVSSGTVTLGEVACWPAIGTETNGVETCGANDYAPAGIAVTTSTTSVILQTDGIAVMKAGDSISDNADVDVLSGAVTIDDAGAQENSLGYAMEIANDADEHIYIRLDF